MILAAGHGTRMRPLTNEIPKPMIPVLGKPIMEYLIEVLASHDVREIMVNVSYLPEQIENYFRDGRRWNVEIGYSFEGSLEHDKIHSHAMGSAGGIRKIQDFGGFFDDTFLVVCGDALIDLDISAALREHRRRGAVASLIVKEVAWEDVSGYGVVVADTDGRITLFQEKPFRKEAASNLASTGIYIFEPEVLDLVPPGKEFDIGTDLFPLLVKRGIPFYAINLPFNWVDIGNVADFWVAHQLVLQGGMRGISMPGREIRPGVWAGLNVCVDWDEVLIDGPIYIGSGSRIEAGSRLTGPIWMGHGCQVKAGAEVSRSILFEYTRVGSAARLEDLVIFGPHCVDRNGCTVNLAEADLNWIVEDARLSSDCSTAAAVLEGLRR